MQHADDTVWQRFCRDIESRIRAARHLAALPCADCMPCTVHRAREDGRVEPSRRCSTCREIKPLDGGFNRDRNKPLGYRYICRDCQRSVNKRTNERRKRRVAREILGVAS
jgi:uncharacterized protein YlaI